ncbi:S41 family peptidase, partial [Bacillus cereus]|nr:S41 family peptidase [Bacillus cereus]
IRLSSFTDKSAADVRRAYERLSSSGKLKGLVLDLRGNTGGVLDGAIDIVGMFVPKGTKVMETKGRLPQSGQEYRTSADPISLDLPLTVLINGSSASASEIVAGSLQDLDRAVLIGSKSFGKGLVQSTRPTPYNGILKVTVARYYIPSGRCIQ